MKLLAFIGIVSGSMVGFFLGLYGRAVWEDLL